MSLDSVFSQMGSAILKASEILV